MKINEKVMLKGYDSLVVKGDFTPYYNEKLDIIENDLLNFNNSLEIVDIDENEITFEILDTDWEIYFEGKVFNHKICTDMLDKIIVVEKGFICNSDLTDRLTDNVFLINHLCDRYKCIGENDENGNYKCYYYSNLLDFDSIKDLEKYFLIGE